MSASAMRAWVVMGVSGCGKSEVGARLARALDVAFIEGDRFHPAANVAKMSAGIPLLDADREGWLRRLAAELARACAQGRGVVLSCSALKRAYRDILRTSGCALVFVHLDGRRETLAARMGARPGHFMPASLLDSQLRDLEPLQADEEGMVLDIEETPEVLVERIQSFRHSRESGNDVRSRLPPAPPPAGSAA